MSRSMVLKIAAAVCVAALIACGGVIFGRITHFGLHYADAERYTAGGTTLDGGVKSLDIDWTDGSVTVAYHSADTVEISETAPKSISADAALRWWLDGDTLRIRYAKSGFMTFRSLKKELTVTLPEGIELESLGIDSTSTNVNVPDVRANDISVSLTSGDLVLAQSGAAEHVSLTNTSGNIDASLSEVGRMVVSGTSSDMRISAKSLKELSVSTTSGNILVESESAGKTRIGSTSGNIDTVLAAFDELQIDATSGNVSVALPSEPGYRAIVKTTSGKFDYTVPLARDGDEYTCGDGSGSLSVSVTSGDIRLTEADRK